MENARKSSRSHSPHEKPQILKSSASSSKSSLSSSEEGSSDEENPNLNGSKSEMSISKFSAMNLHPVG